MRGASALRRRRGCLVARPRPGRGAAAGASWIVALLSGRRLAALARRIKERDADVQSLRQVRMENQSATVHRGRAQGRVRPGPGLRPGRLRAARRAREAGVLRGAEIDRWFGQGILKVFFLGRIYVGAIRWLTRVLLMWILIF